MLFDKLEGERVVLMPLAEEHIEPLYECSRNPIIWTHYPIEISSIKDMETFVYKALDGRKENEQFPYAVFDKSLNKIIGTTRYLRISDVNRNLNIGSTWYTPEVWRTRVNTECKYLLLRFAFEQWAAVRVEIITTPDNMRSQKAIERLGALREGVFRKKYNQRDYVIYSFIDEEWKEIKERLERFLNEPNTLPTITSSLL
ncbi:RimJ/RimL family protein N-acetyltransferase [Paenibacillus castaneae]|uniref:GNAT family N-acetyltransferase n=1 Tax=Paenibacillus castaneae TaxID=474957 RepID=UPI000C9C40B6|nr:GNAT family protein [Paenibacillus castaneae]NIK80236.1 RimJ/RimL family protein N-acetyltransferase [Paenibacillus castaneae]